jgi:DNA-binding NtrC family response regulator
LERYIKDEGVIMQTILYIDHVGSHRFLLQEELSEEGYQVVTAKSIVEVLSTWRNPAPDLIILELRQLTVQEESVENLRKRFPGILCIGYSTFDQCPDEYRKWVDEYLPKLSSMENVKKLIKDLTIKQ